MELKEKIEKLLLNLKKLGFDRKTIEKDLGYAPNFINRTFSTGGTTKFLKVLEQYFIDKTKSEKGDPLYNTNEERIQAIEIQMQVLLHALARIDSKVSGESLTSVYMDYQRQLDKEIKRYKDEA